MYIIHCIWWWVFVFKHFNSSRSKDVNHQRKWQMCYARTHITINTLMKLNKILSAVKIRASRGDTFHSLQSLQIKSLHQDISASRGNSDDYHSTPCLLTLHLLWSEAEPLLCDIKQICSFSTSSYWWEALVKSSLQHTVTHSKVRFEGWIFPVHCN